MTAFHGVARLGACAADPDTDGDGARFRAIGGGGGTGTLVVDGAPVTVGVQGVERDGAALSAALTALGYGAACHSLAEIVVCAYVQWGARFADRLGDAATAAVRDGRTGRLLLVRGHAAGPVRYLARRDMVCFCTATSTATHQHGCPEALGRACTGPVDGIGPDGRDTVEPGCMLTFVPGPSGPSVRWRVLRGGGRARAGGAAAGAGPGRAGDAGAVTGRRGRVAGRCAGAVGRGGPPLAGRSRTSSGLTISPPAPSRGGVAAPYGAVP